jgi:hypothetical protein
MFPKEINLLMNALTVKAQGLTINISKIFCLFNLLLIIFFTKIGIRGEGLPSPEWLVRLCKMMGGAVTGSHRGIGRENHR